MFSIATFTHTLQKRPFIQTKDERGLTTVEYVIILVLIAVGSIGVWKTFGQKVSGQITNSTTAIETLSQKGTAAKAAK